MFLAGTGTLGYRAPLPVASYDGGLWGAVPALPWVSCAGTCECRRGRSTGLRIDQNGSGFPLRLPFSISASSREEGSAPICVPLGPECVVSLGNDEMVGLLQAWGDWEWPICLHRLCVERVTNEIISGKICTPLLTLGTHSSESPGGLGIGTFVQGPPTVSRLHWSFLLSP